MNDMHRTIVTRTTISHSRAIIAVLVSFLVAGATYAMKAATESTEYKPEGDMYVMEVHFRWCGDAKTPTERLKRYQGFWEMQHPKSEDGYDDSRHIRIVRHCAYRMAQLYAELGKTDDCVRMLKWLEKEDDAFEVEQG